MNQLGYLQLFLTGFILLFHSAAIAQQGAKFLQIPKVNAIELDGTLNERAWSKAKWSDAFVQNYPSDSLPASAPTKVKVVYTEKGLCVAAICAFSDGSVRNTRTLRRDFGINNNDAFSVVIDPMLDRNNGFVFSVTPDGVMREGLISFSSRTDAVWDNRWQVKTQVLDTCWVVEMFIPFNTLRYNEAQTKWGINFIRNEIALNEVSVWNPVPREFGATNLGYAGTAAYTSPLPTAKFRAAIIPYVAGGANKMGDSISTVGNAGADFKTAVTPSLNLDVTINPDFSQAEVDQQVINLDRFSVYFPERRPFFIENNDLFSTFGFSKIRPFFSRRIGLAQDGSIVPILAGARLSGKVNQDWRIGVLNMQTQPNTDGGLPQNYSVACFQRQTRGNSNISAIMVNRQGVGKGWENDYNRIVGVDYNILSADNRWRGKVFYHQSFSDDNQHFQYAHASWLTHTSRTFTATWNHEYVSKFYQADVGFVPRQGMGYWRLEPWVEKRFYPNGGALNMHGPKLYYSIYTDENFDPTDSKLQLSYRFVLQNTSELRVGAENTYVRLTEPFNPNPNDSLQFGIDQYSWNQYYFNFVPSSRNRFSVSPFGSYGSFYDGYLASYGGDVYYRFEPYLRFGLNVSMNQLMMPEPYLDDNLMLVRPTVDISFSRQLFFNTLVQLNRQTNTLAVNSRLQWRFAPMSDLYLVYNQQLSSDSLHTEQQTLLVKMNYWLNI